MSERLALRAGTWLAARSTRRDVLVRATVVGAALATSPLRYVLRPLTATQVIAGATLDRSCPPGSPCTADGYAAFCCTINRGINACPPGTIAGGWWKADGSVYCRGPRYYIDCSGTCSRCTTGCETGFCPDCDTVGPCDCANGDCGNRRTGCRTFRYGQCNQHVPCIGRLACRVVSCTPPWELEPSCTRTSATDNQTANHHAPCLDNAVAPVVAMVATRTGSGYWLARADGRVAAFGDAKDLGSVTAGLNRPILGMAATASETEEGLLPLRLPLRLPILDALLPAPPGGYWLVAGDGGIFAFGDARFHGSTGAIRLNRAVVGMAATPSGGGYWLVASDGGIFAFGDAPFLGSMGNQVLRQPIVGMAATRTGAGYWLVAADGGIFAFGDAPFLGSMGNQVLRQPIVGMAATPSGGGYWLVGRDGGVFAFGDANFYGAAGDRGGVHIVTALVATPSGMGYWLATAHGDVLAFGDASSFGGRS